MVTAKMGFWARSKASFGSSQSLLLSHPTNGIIFWRHDSAYVTRICAACLIPSLA